PHVQSQFESRNTAAVVRERHGYLSQRVVSHGSPPHRQGRHSNRSNRRLYTYLSRRLARIHRVTHGIRGMAHRDHESHSKSLISRTLGALTPSKRSISFVVVFPN